MSDDYQPVLHIDDEPRVPYAHGEHYQCDDVLLGEPLRLSQLGAVYTELPPGKSACPYHVHHCEDELFIVLSGKGEYRFGGVVHAVGAGDVLGAPRGGPEFAHKLTNTGAEVMKYLAISSKSDSEVCEYPDSGKFLVRTGGKEPEFRFVGREDTAVDYWDGEDD